MPTWGKKNILKKAKKSAVTGAKEKKSVTIGD